MPPQPPEQPSLNQELRREWTVSERHLYNPAGSSADPQHAVLSSPSMIWEMEITCTELAERLIGEGETTVGFHVDVKHVSPAKPGASIVTVARLTVINGKKLTFRVDAYEGERLVGTGMHRRAIVSLADLG